MQDFSYARLTAFFFFVAWFPLLIIHEFGHAIMANLVGWQLKCLVIGFGEVKRTYRMPSWLQEMDVYIKSIPLEGFVQCMPRDMRGFRWKGILVSFAGPGVEILIGGILWYVLLQLGHPSFNAPADSISVAACQGIAVSAFFGAAINLFPHGVHVNGQLIANDGLSIVQYLTEPMPEN